jgi:hypothetical protein
VVQWPDLEMITAFVELRYKMYGALPPFPDISKNAILRFRRNFSFALRLTVTFKWQTFHFYGVTY